MEEHLEDVIDYHLSEIYTLRKLLNDCLEEGNYLGAHQYKKALYVKTKEYYQLLELKYHNFKDIRVIESKINSVKRLLRSEVYEERREKLEDQLLQLEEEWMELEEASIKFNKRRRVNRNVLDEALEEAKTGKVEKIRFILNKTENLYLDVIFHSPFEVDLAFTPFLEIKSAQLLGEKRPKQLRYHGFEEQEGRLKVTLRGEEAILLGEVKEMLVKLVFETFESYVDLVQTPNFSMLVYPKDSSS